MAAGGSLVSHAMEGECTITLEDVAYQLGSPSVDNRKPESSSPLLVAPSFPFLFSRFHLFSSLSLLRSPTTVHDCYLRRSASLPCALLKLAGHSTHESLIPVQINPIARSSEEPHRQIKHCE
ncbi:hypothetical protein PIB30_016945 [Stylosanthes scabra]|uniref:Uncharacterized protein n=1 Tax=Stylosanthes scabra TaxID=79078 RepID=A0ABU6Y9F0_9FABA|nr:hypothetical protein [Stylosanthes scabra]